MKYADYKYNTDNTASSVFAVVLFVGVFLSANANAQLFGGQLKTNNKIPATITLAQDQMYFIASVYDTDYLPYTTPTTAASTATVAADGTTESVTVNVQGSITTTGVTVTIPVTVTDSGTLPAYSTTINIPAELTQDGISSNLIFSWASQAYTTATTSITATIAAVSGTLNAKKLDINAGMGNDFLGVLLGTFSYPYNNAGALTTYQVRDISGIPDKMFGQYDNGNTTTYEHNFLYVTVVGEDGKTWLSNNLGADYANLSSSSFSPTTQATVHNDYLAYGSLFQWCRKPDGHELIDWTGSTMGTPKYGTTSTKSNAPTDALFITGSSFSPNWQKSPNLTLWATEASANNPCPRGFRVPTDAELTSLFKAAGITNTGTAFTSKLKFSNPGLRFYTHGGLSYTSNNGYCWSSTPDTSSGVSFYRYFYFNTTKSVSYYVTFGYSVRCIKN